MSTTIRNVSGTAFVVAEFRADENSAVAPLYNDPIVSVFLSDESRSAATRIAARFPAVKDMVKVRTKYLDDMLDRQLRANVRQVLILGAGLDTRAVRKRAPNVRYFEIDDPATLGHKHACYARHHIEADVCFIPGNYVTDGFIDQLRRKGFDFHLPTYVIWEGNVMYLPLESDRHVLTELRRHVARFHLSFDYLAEAVITKTTGDDGIVTLVDSFANMGAPWISGISDVGRFAREMRMRLVENFQTAELYRTYWPNRPMESPIFNFYSICTLASDVDSASEG
jgi:methyltransferase (TIGR00027 family)